MTPPHFSDDSPAVAVITVSYGSEAVLPGFLTSVNSACATKPLLIIADNKPGPLSRVRELAEDYGAHYLPLPMNPGYGGGMNAAAADLPESIEWILISNPDVELGVGTIDRLVHVGSADPTIGSVGPAIITLEGNVYPSARTIPSLRTGIGHALFANLWINNPWTRVYRNESGDADKQRDAGWLSGSCLLVRRRAFEALGGFDSRYFMYFEDVDLGYRLGQAGWRNVYVPDVSAKHVGAHATEGESAAMIAAHHESARRFLARKYSNPLLWPVRVFLTVGLNVRSRLLQRRELRSRALGDQAVVNNLDK
ncbi:glycosyltransferase family 2 protein [Microbacterium sp. STN6]|uniref:glycosyltransferase n=1 Tax=Microbacterium sp. STN6 TaxID=2995588 RepID=UPI002260C8B0|nr:glycosyltransferase family 2 protein [Microbacterium sp. STN6]MCX7521023.1 glycosyltransferase family 2 protein [Microbacterium sp. STN6]